MADADHKFDVDNVLSRVKPNDNSTFQCSGNERHHGQSTQLNFDADKIYWKKWQQNITFDMQPNF